MTDFFLLDAQDCLMQSPEFQARFQLEEILCSCYILKLLKTDIK